VSEQGLTSPPTQYRSSGRQFYRSKTQPTASEYWRRTMASHQKRIQSRQALPTVLRVINTAVLVQKVCA